jgi:hypothetical protein
MLDELYYPREDVGYYTRAPSSLTGFPSEAEAKKGTEVCILILL